MKGYTYILKCTDGSFYTGSTKNIEQRFYQHQQGEGANHTKKRLPVKLVFVEEFERIDEAYQREKQVQGWSRKKKQALIDGAWDKLKEYAECQNESHCSALDSAPFDSAPFDSAPFDSAPFDSAQGTGTVATSVATAPVTAPKYQHQHQHQHRYSVYPERSRREGTIMTTSQEHNVPALRFPEFFTLSEAEGNGEWVSVKLGNIAAFNKGKGISKADISDDGALECIRYGQLYTDYAETINDIKSRTNVPENELVLSESNDIIIPASGETQIDIATASCVLKSGVALGGDLNIVKTKHNGVFLSYYLNSKRKYDIARLSQGISVVHLYAAQLKLLHINLPDSKEQQKIASFLTSVDTKIEQLGKKKTLLEKYKKGMMQKLFPSTSLRAPPSAGSGHVPVLRFNTGMEMGMGMESVADHNQNSVAEPVAESVAERSRSYPDWEEKQLGEVCKVNPKVSNLPSEFVYIDLESVVSGSLIKESKILKAEAPSRAQRLLAKHDVLFQMVRPYQKNNYYFNTEGDYVASTGYAQLRATGSAKFLYQIIHTNAFVNKVLGRCTGTSYPAINSSDLGKIHLSMPSLLEQQKIANFLSALDQKIDLIATELNLAKTFKKGLLQQMFV